jgi:serine/threonine-protein kinase
MLERIGLGGMVETYSAVTTGEGGFRRSVVIKRLLPQLADDPVAVAQFCGEANLLAALHHPNIVAVQDFGRAGDQLFLAEEYILGRDLGQLVKRNLERQRRALAPEVAAHVCFEVLKALDYVHSLRNEQERPLGIVHGDISPENIMISWRGEVKLLDIGVGKLNDGTPSPSEPSVIKGSATFKSPEQARGVNDDARSDLYATALIMYYCLAGKPLYESDTGYGLLLKAAAGPGPEEWAAVARLPARLSMILRRAWAPRMENRYQTAREMAASLENLIGDGAQQTQTLLEQLFGKELIAEERRLAEAPIEPSHREIMLT